jgi:nucleotide-binding universal stress UspA family protein
MPDMSRSPVVIATDLTEHAVPALIRGRAHAEAAGVPFIVIHVIPDVLHHHPLAPSLRENDAMLAVDLTKKAADLVTEQVGRVLRVPADDYRVVIEIGDAEDAIVRLAEEQHASLVAVGAKPRHGVERVLGHVAERVVRYAHTSVLIARPGAQNRKILIATDLTETALPALRIGAMLVEKVGVDATLLHVVQRSRSSSLVPVLSVLGSPWMPPPQPVFEQLEALGRKTLEGLARQYGFAHTEQVDGDPGQAIAERADAIDAEMIVMASHGRTGLRRLVLGSTAEKVIRMSTRSVLVTRPTI